MKQTTEEVIHRMEIELNELTGRICSLERFIVSKDFQEVTRNQKALLAQQYTAMEQYKEILLKRLVDLRNQEKLEKEMTCGTVEKAPEAKSGTPTD